MENRVAREFRSKFHSLMEADFYEEMAAEYNSIISSAGKVNRSAFYAQRIAPRLPDFTAGLFYRFVARYADKSGRLPGAKAVVAARNEIIEKEKKSIESLLARSSKFTQEGIATAIALGNITLQECLENPGLLTANERIKLLFDAMKAQDSRVRALAELKKDAREQKVFDKVFNEAVYLDTSDGTQN